MLLDNPSGIPCHCTFGTDHT